MNAHEKIPGIGVEEEYQLVDPRSGQLLPNCKQVMREIRDQPHADIQHELHPSQIEMASDRCETLAQVRDNLKEVRGVLIDAARRTGAELVAAGTNPLPVPDDAVTSKERYERMAERFQQIARDLFIFGCHVHVSMPDRRLGTLVMNQSRRWLPLLQAVSANSPYWHGQDTGYMSYRWEMWAQWPMAGPPPHFNSFEDFQGCVSDLIASQAIEDESHIYWDIRLPVKVPTIEFRCADVMTSIEEAVGFTGLVRAIVMRATTDVLGGQQNPPIRTPVLRSAQWQAARYGTSDSLVDPLTCQSLPAAELIDRLRRDLEPALERTGDTEIVHDFLDSVLKNGCGAERQLRLEADALSVVQHLITETAAGCHPTRNVLSE